MMWIGNKELLRREQQIVLANGYATLSAIPNVSHRMTVEMENPMYWAGAFTGTDVTEFNQRWSWIQSQVMAPWQALSKNERDRLVKRDFQQLVDQK